jgi:DNA-binding transcriptional regulator YdaS (Cro superfamily)
VSETVRRNLEKQREYYGEIFGERARRLVVGYDISQAQLADVLGVSAPMLSQVMSGRRQKMANPAVWARLVMLERILQTVQGDEQLRDGWPRCARRRLPQQC